MRRSLAPLLAILVLLAVQAVMTRARHAGQENCFPLQEGYWWTYRDSYGRHVEAFIADSDAYKASDGTNVTSVIMNGDGQMGWGWFAVSRGWVWQYAADGGRGHADYDPPVCHLPTSLRVGEQWELNSCGETGRAVVEKQERLSTPAGTFTCFEVHRIWEKGPGSPSEEREWYAPGVGLVQRFLQHDTKPYLLLLGYGSNGRRR